MPTDAMKLNRPTLLALLLGTIAGFAIAVSSGVLAGRSATRDKLPASDVQLLAEVMARVKDEYVDPVGDHELMLHAIRGMVSGLDAHSTFLDKREVEDLRIATEGSYSGVGIEVSYDRRMIVVVAPIEGSPADLAGMRTGDVITAIDGWAVATAGIEDVVSRMRGEPGTLVRVTVERGDQDLPVEFTIRRAEIQVQSVRHALLEPGYGYLRITHFSETTAHDVDAAVEQLRSRANGHLTGLVLDLRNNPGGVLEAGIEVADAFLDEGVIVTASGRTPAARFTAEAKRGDVTRGARLIVLVNAGSASSAEIVAGALKDHGRAVVMGRTTFGKGSVQTVLPLSDGQAVKLTTSRYLTPAGTVIQNAGVTPDIVTSKSPREDLDAPQHTEGRATAADPAADPEIARALAWLKSAPQPRVAAEAAARRH